MSQSLKVCDVPWPLTLTNSDPDIDIGAISEESTKEHQCISPSPGAKASSILGDLFSNPTSWSFAKLRDVGRCWSRYFS